jgi:thiopeptide-type bacteriocin biosynthesis protein
MILLTCNAGGAPRPRYTSLPGLLDAGASSSCAPFTRYDPVATTSGLLEPRHAATDERVWLSAHLHFDGALYGADADAVILDVVAPFFAWCRDEGLADRYFFVRYGSGGAHIRVRVRGAPDVVARTIRPALAARVKATGTGADARVSHLRWIDYEPEVERYGGPDALLVAEDIFHASSDTAIALLAPVRGASRSGRLGKGLLAMLTLLHVFIGERASAAALAKYYAEGYLRIIASTDDAARTPWRQAFDFGYHRQAGVLAAYVDEAWRQLCEGDELPGALAEYKVALTARRDALRALCDRRRLATPTGPVRDWPDCLSRILPNYMHMMNNRLGLAVAEESYLGHLTHRVLDASLPV